MSFLLMILVLIAPAFAELDRINIKNLDLNYVSPEGKGEFEKLSIGLELTKVTYPVEIFRRDHAFDILSPFIDFQWLNPFAFIHNAQKINTKQLNLNIDHKLHYLRGDALSLTTEKATEIGLKQYNITCQGSSTEKDPLERLKYDCLENIDVTVNHLELPVEFFNSLATQLPDEPTEEAGEMPADDLALSLKKGDFSAQLRVKLILRATLRVKGHARLENEGSVFAIRVDEIKYGIIPVTNIVMNELRRQVRKPNVVIDPPWIRIKSGNK